ncbi:CgeB family protein [Longirhabdus pacifica]|uniref:CgeB family protein n=1 Tax=Longirhabdus pacifica TaxID=2305227 RepID=UPI0013E8A573|nr:glycosyltransferase [Longirhabdus pacifica]
MRVLCLMTLDRFRLNLGWALESIGYDVYHINEIQEQSLEEAIQIHKPDMFFDVGWDVEHCDPNKLKILKKVLKKHDIFHVYFAEEDELHFERWSKQYVLLMEPEFVITRGAECVQSYDLMGFNAMHMDIGCNVEFHYPTMPDPELQCDISVIGNVQFAWDIYRRQCIRELIVPLFDTGFDVKIWGKDWDDDEFSFHFEKYPPKRMMQGMLPYSRTPAAYNAAKINIGIQSVEEQISNRAYEIMSSGGFLLTSNTEAVQRHLMPGQYCVTSNSAQETIELCEYYLTHEQERIAIANRGMQYVHANYTYQKILPPVMKVAEQHILRGRG